MPHFLFSLTTVFALMAMTMLVSAAAMAGSSSVSISQTGGGQSIVTHSGNGSTVSIVQTSVKRGKSKASSSHVKVHQNGGNNISRINQSSANNVSEVHQKGRHNDSEVRQVGKNNNSLQVQTGKGQVKSHYHSGGEVQAESGYGHSNRAKTLQIGDNDISINDVDGSNNDIHVEQSGDRMQQRIEHIGTGTSITIEQGGNTVTE